MTRSGTHQQSSLAERIAKLVSQLQSRGVIFSDGVQAQEIPGRGIGVIACRMVPAGEQIVQFPVTSLLNPRTAKAALLREVSDGGADAACSMFTPTATPNREEATARKRRRRDASVKTQAGKYASLLDSLSSHQLLAYYLYRARLRRDSDWNSFLDVLPTLDTFGGLPLVWAVLDHGRKRFLDYLPANTYEHAARMSKQFWGDLSAVRSIFANVEDVELFIWAWLCVNSRCLYYYMAEAPTSSDCMTLAPVVDFLNHSDDEHCSIQIYDGALATKFFGLVTTRSYDVGDEICLSYGAHTNSFLLCEYGFTLAVNKNTELDITAELLAILKCSRRTSRCHSDSEGAEIESPKLAFLEAHGYLGDYTLSLDTISYRTEVALAVSQVREEVCREPTGDDEPRARTLERSQLKAFISGMANGSKFKARSTATLNTILDDVVKNCDIMLAKANDDVECGGETRENIVRLYNERKQIACSHLRPHR
ncbi:hypothetical protein POJ06DRAFT_255178 [Lipomyces tetrasporus]|uniref:SET domain-containing protein n=1 Tax=Lipomyces tetrasporus TaxID=54092 RepID=A0AAD7QS95_9ASCO|nr:uncharacterized protein POJ06DRAFT_255178 [Lipomyces tetrasporus]KAJ8100011.1 hypothetical protein POJ06DRAFT_255178 [Lipomyces tetrasporus]